PGRGVTNQIFVAAGHAVVVLPSVGLDDETVADEEVGRVQAASPTRTAAPVSSMSASCSSTRARARRPIMSVTVATRTDAPANRYGTVGPNACHRAAAMGGAAAPPRNRTAEYDDEATERGRSVDSMMDSVSTVF